MLQLVTFLLKIQDKYTRLIISVSKKTHNKKTDQQSTTLNIPDSSNIKTRSSMCVKILLVKTHILTPINVSFNIKKNLIFSLSHLLQLIRITNRFIKILKMFDIQQCVD